MKPRAIHTASYQMFIVLHTHFPCCGGKASFRAVRSVPREVYTRICSHCGTKYEVDRLSLPAADACRIDKLDWTVMP